MFSSALFNFLTFQAITAQLTCDVKLFAVQKNSLYISAVFDRCAISDRNVGFYNISAQELATKVDLSTLLDCERTIRKKIIRTFLRYKRQATSLTHQCGGWEKKNLQLNFNPFLPDCKATFSQIFYIFLCYF